mmetsp:Transcript_993/g.2368  ORF Transcript_993/g.2368 Transcript_993/m.2368 type:complete len:409 (+) Transcript_993:575-1801(+)
MVYYFTDETFETDSRAIDFEFSVPFLGDDDDTRFGFVAPSGQYWAALTVSVSIQTLLTIITMIIAWFVVKSNRGTSVGFLATFGLITPIILCQPFYILSYIGIVNTVIATPFVVFGATNALKMIEIYYATSPPFAETNLSNFLLYHSSPVLFRFHPKTQAVLPTTREEINEKLKQAASSFVVTVILMNIQIQTNYQPFGPTQLNTIMDYFNWRHLGNNLANAHLAGTNLETGTLLYGCLISMLTGYSTINLNDSPFTKSTSVADFWGRRWNKQVGGNLKNGIFKACLKNGYSKTIGIVLTFVGSSLLHEYVIFSGASEQFNPGREPYVPQYGRQSTFFLWNGMMMVIEAMLMKTSFKATWESIPRPLKTFLVVMTSLPVSRWFMDDYIGVNLFSDFAMAFPFVYKLQK